MWSETFLGGAGVRPGRMEKGDSMGSGECSGDTEQDQPPALSLVPLPRAFLLSPFLSGVKPIPLTSHAEQFSPFVVLIALAPADSLPSDLTFLPRSLAYAISKQRPLDGLCCQAVQ